MRFTIGLEQALLDIEGLMERNNLNPLDPLEMQNIWKRIEYHYLNISCYVFQLQH